MGGGWLSQSMKSGCDVVGFLRCGLLYQETIESAVKNVYLGDSIVCIGVLTSNESFDTLFI